MLAAIKFTFIMTILTGVVYPFVMTGFAQLVFPKEANGSLVKNGSELIAQKFVLDKYFWPRPSAIDYNAMSSGGSNLGPTSEVLATAVKERGFASGSGLDPHISVDAAQHQIARVAKARGLSEEAVSKLVAGFAEARQFGILGETRVNVLKLNLALDKVN